MATLWGRTLTRREIMARVGDVSQIARARLHRLADGYEDGTLAVDVATGSGLEFTVLPSRGLDISSASFGGRSLAWRSAQSDRHPAFYEPTGLGWLRSFAGGLVTTCGLTWMGAPGPDGKDDLGLHGRHSNAPATGVRAAGEWVGDDYVLTVEGAVREAVVFGENVVLQRKITTSMGALSLRIEDTVTNDGFETVPHMLLYHVNLGYPIVEDGARISIVPAAVTEPRDAEAADGGERWMCVEPPQPGYKEKCYFHRPAAGPDGFACAILSNPALDGGLGVSVRFRPDQLPWLVEWKMMGAGAYVVGLEPANALVMGRATERAAGRLQHLEPGEARRYEVEIGVRVGADDPARS